MSHGITKCRKCDAVVSQCRCMNHRHVRYVNGCGACAARSVEKKPYEPPAILDTAEFETLALSCAKHPGPEPDCHGPGGTPHSS